MTTIQIPKNNSVSFNEYLHNIISNKPSSFATDWGFFVSIDEQTNLINPINQKIDINDISETIFDMDLPDTIIKENIYNQIKSNIYFIGALILNGSTTCLKKVISV